MKKLELKPGDVFATNTGAMIGSGINIFQRIFSDDGQANYSHAGIITSEAGDTFEAKRQIYDYHLKDYDGDNIIIARCENETYGSAMAQLRKDHEAVVYPYWRIVLHMFGPWVARHVGFGKWWLVCSEVVAKYLFLIGMRHDKFRGTTPDKLVDEWRRWKGFDIVYEGKIYYNSETKDLYGDDNG